MTVYKIYYSWRDIEVAVSDIASQIYQSDWRPNYIVGLTRGGLIPAVLLSHMLGCKMFSLDVRLRDNDDAPESNFWMAEDANNNVNILIIDDINDSGETIKWIKNDWRDRTLEDKSIWSNNVRVAVLVNNNASPVAVDYHSLEVNKAEKDCWLVYPWEEWYKHAN